MGELRRLAKTCNFGAYLETALCDQFVCGLKCQQELSCEANLTVEIALKKARAAEVEECKRVNATYQKVIP